MKLYQQIPDQLPAFTLAELLITLAVMALAANLSLSGLNLLRSQYRQFDKIQSQLWEAGQLTLALHHEAGSARLMETAPGELIFTHSPALTVTYRFEEGHTLRIVTTPEGLSQDTFALSGQATEATFQGKPADAGIAGYCRVQFTLFGEEQAIHLYKHYSTYELINARQQ